MSILASDIFSFLETHASFNLRRHEVGSRSFASLRRNLRYIVRNLYEEGDETGRGVGDELRLLLYEWLTVPVPFDGDFGQAIQEVLGSPSDIERRWGRD